MGQRNTYKQTKMERKCERGERRKRGEMEARGMVEASGKASWRRSPCSQNGWDSGKDAEEIGKGRRSRAWRKIIGLENGGAGMVLPPLTLQASAP